MAAVPVRDVSGWHRVVPPAELVVVVTGQNHDRHFVGPLPFLVREILPTARDRP
jgi:hypothetical protein